MAVRGRAIVRTPTVSGSPGEDSQPILVSCIVWGNGGESIWFDADSTTEATYSCIEGDGPFPGEGNTGEDPQFCRAGQWNDNSTPGTPEDDDWVEGDLRLSPDSPCIGHGAGGTDMGAPLGICVLIGFLRGDANADGGLDIADPISILHHLFAQSAVPSCADAADANDDGSLNIADPIAILQHLFSGGVPLPAPFGACGIDESSDYLSCESFPPCATAE